jgi:hypothetical protein
MSAIFNNQSMLQADGGASFGLSTEYSIAGWAKRTANTGTDEAIWSLLGSPESSYLRMDQDGSDPHYPFQGDGDVRLLSRNNAVSTNTWHYFIMRHTNGVDPEIWVDAWANKFDQNNGLSAGAMDFSTFNKFNIGAFFAASQNFDGLIAEIAFWNTALNDAAIQALIGGTPPNDPSVNTSLIHYWPLYDGPQDLQGNIDQADHPNTVANPVTYTTGDHPVAPPVTDDPQHTGPTELDYRVGEPVGDIDVRTWWDSQGTITDITITPLPAGVTYAGNTTYILGGAPSGRGDTASVMTCTDDAGGNPVQVTIDWAVTPYAISFTGPTRLEKSDGTTVNTSKAQMSAFKGAVGSGLGAAIHQEADISISNGEYTISLPDDETTLGETYTILMEDTTDPVNTVPLGAYERVST